MNIEYCSLKCQLKSPKPPDDEQPVKILSNRFGIYHMTDETDGGISWYNFAKEIVRLAHFGNEMNPVRSAEFPRAANRPKNSVLDTTAEKFAIDADLSRWMDSLKEFLKSS